MNKLLLLLPLFLLSACDDGTSSADIRSYGYVQRGLDQTPGLSDCKAYMVDGDKMIRCPNSTTMAETKHRNGKITSTYHVIVIDGQKYVPVKK